MSPFETWLAGSTQPGHSGALAWGTTTVHTACLRPTTMPPETLQGVMQHLQQEAICVLTHEQEYGTSALYVHAARPLCHLLDPKVLDTIDLQPQRALIYKLSPPYDPARVQQSMNVCAARHLGINAAVAHEAANLLTVFEDPISSVASKLGHCYNYCAVIQQNVGAIRIQGTVNGTQDLEPIRRTLFARPEITSNKVTLHCDYAAITLLPAQNAELAMVHSATAEVLQGLGLPYQVVQNRFLLYSKEKALPNCCCTEVEILPADVGDDIGHTNLTTCDMVAKVLSESGCTWQLSSNHSTIGFDLAAVKCQKCAQSIASAVVENMPDGASCCELALNWTRNILLASTTLDDPAPLMEHITTLLLGLGVKTNVLFSAEEAVDPHRACQQLQKFSCVAQSPTVGATELIEIKVRDGSLSCDDCASSLQKVLHTVLDGACNIAVDTSSSAVVIEFCHGQVTEDAIVATLDGFGYQPEVSQRGDHLADAFNSIKESISDENCQLSATMDFTPGGSQEYAAACTAKLYVGQKQVATAADLLLVCKPTISGEQAAAYELLIKEPEKSPTPVSPDSTPVFLENEYTIWYDKVVDRSKPNAPEGTLVELESFQSLQDFWRAWKELDLLGLQEGDVIMVFRRHVQPNIHHPVNKAGGRWYTRALPLETRVQLWTGLVLAMLGEFLEDNTNNEVCGVVLSVKPGGDRIEVWVDGDYHHHAKHGHDNIPLHRQLSPTMGDILARVLQLNPGRHRLHYWTHVAYERHRKLHSGSARRDKRKHKMVAASQGPRNPGPF